MEYIFTFQNTHHAIQAEKILLAGNVSVNVMPTPSELGNLCGICLRVTPADFSAACQMLNEKQAKIKAIYIKDERAAERKYVEWLP